MKFTFSYYRERGLPFVSFTRTLGRPRQGWVDNIKMDLHETGWVCGLVSSGSGYGKVEVSCEHKNEFLGSTKRREILDWLRSY